jgi:hypothetical protein
MYFSITFYRAAAICSMHLLLALARAAVSVAAERIERAACADEVQASDE